MRPTSTLFDLAARVDRPAAPLVTYYDAGTGERVELSGVTTANWVAKTANFLLDELDAETGARLRIGLPSHWLRIVWLLSAWQVGAVVTDRDAGIAVTGPDLDADEPTRVASALLPFGVRFPTPPEGFLDIGAEIPGHPDIFLGLDRPDPQSPAVDLPGLAATHADLLGTAPDDRRLLIGEGDVTRDAVLLVAACLGRGSLVLCRGGDEADHERIAVQEQATIWSPTV
ncbi:TIGR03089 family protein [Aeromicrobium sp. Leaf350]|uniref:TIGR03089 family protein n=1 Tax=Aeromicrobium sp. Leaf350 TaxID=2876565 RepID=UPI001E3A48CF|nr:TIGR03089 family protein [Aeromicrobium sp. Leaf350]